MAFNRIIELSIGPPGAPGIVIKNLRINFQIDKSDAESGNKGVIKIYNLSKSSATQYGKVGNKIIVRAGYSDEGPVRSLFFGDITRTIYTTESTEKILTIEATDGQSNSTDTNISISYGAGTFVGIIVNDVLQNIGLPLASPFTAGPQTYNNGYAFIGRAKDSLTETLAYIGKSWTIQNEQIVIYSPGEAVIRTGIVLSSSSGLLRTPEELEDKDTDQVIEDVPKRYRIVFLLDARVLPGSELQLRSSEASGVFRVDSVTFNGDNFEGDYTGTAEVRTI